MKLRNISVFVLIALATSAVYADPLVFNSEEEFIAAVEKAQNVITERKISNEFKVAEIANAEHGKALMFDCPVYGDPKARYLITVYSDLECPACRYYHPFLKDFIKRHSDEVAFVFNHFPLDFHGTKAREEAKAALCAGKLKSVAAEWAVIDVLFETTEGNGEGSTYLPYTAKALDIDREAFNACIMSNETEFSLNEMIKRGFDAKIGGTPTLVFKDTQTGMTVFSGGGTVEELEAKLKKLKEGKVHE